MNETDGTDPTSGPNTNSTIDRTLTLNFTEDEGAYTATLSFATVEDSADSDDTGTITVTLQDDPAVTDTYTVSTEIGANIAEVVVINEDSLPVLSIADATNPTAESAGSVDFVVTAEGASTMTVFYQASEVASGNFLNVDNGQEGINTAELTFVQADGSTGLFVDTLSVAIHDDEIGEITGKIEVTLVIQTGIVRTYRVLADGTEQAEATIWDDDAPELSISGDSATTEGEPAMFTITAQVLPANSTVNIDYTPVSTNFLATTVTGVKEENHPLVFSGDGPYTAPLVVAIDDDTVVDEKGTLTVTLNQKDPIAGYTVTSVSGGNEATIDVYDDEGLPVVTIATDYDAVIESAGEATFELTATGLTTSPTKLMINVTATEVGGNFLADVVQDPAVTVQDQPETIEVEFTDSGDGVNYVGTFPIDIVADNVGEISAPIQVTINQDPEPQNRYKLGDTRVAMVKILDDELPELTIAAGSPITEADGVQAVFTISSVMSIQVLSQYELTTLQKVQII